MTKAILDGASMSSYRENGFMDKMSEWPSVYSLLIFYFLSKLLIYMETSIGYKLASMSRR